MFQVDRHGIDHRIREAESNYIIRPNDELTLEVHTNRGEKLIDPNRQSFTDAGTGVRATTPVKYVVDLNGTVDLPLIGRIALKDLTLQQAEELLAEAYEAFYEEPFIVLTFTNKRVSVLGATGGRVVPLQYENMRLSEVLALAENITVDGRTDNIRVLRGEQIFIADFSSVSRYRENDIIIEPNDVIYVEPARRPFTQTLREISPLVSIATSLFTVIYVATQSNR